MKEGKEFEIAIVEKYKSEGQIEKEWTRRMNISGLHTNSERTSI